MFGGSVIYPDYPWSGKIEKLAKKLYKQAGNKEPYWMGYWHSYIDEAKKLLNNKKEASIREADNGR